ncbi:MAG: phosphatase [Cytophagales bacterium]
MKKNYIFGTLVAACCAVNAQTSFPKIVEPAKIGATAPTTVVVPPSPIKSQILFVGGTDLVAYKALAERTINGAKVYGEAAGTTPAKEWHDFIGFTEATESEKIMMANAGHNNFLGWVSVNHEMVWNDNKIGDGGGMTVFAVKKDLVGDTLVIVPQNLATEGFPAGTHKFFNVDFAGTVGETGMNCGGIQSAKDGRIWTAEEWFRSNIASIWDGNNRPFSNGGPGQGVRDTLDWTISTDIQGDFNNKSVKKHQNFNWMVEIDPRKAKAIRKQYNWGRQGFEGGVIMPDDKTVYLGEDGSPGLFTKFVADVAGDFTKGKTYVYKWDNDNTPDNNWIEIDNTKLDSMMSITTLAYRKGATPFCRIEWVTFDKTTGKVYFTETGNDNWRIGSGRSNVTIGQPMVDFFRTRRAEMGSPVTDWSDAQIRDSLRLNVSALRDFYGRVTEYDPATGKIKTHIEGGRYFASSPAAANYPEKHLTNPDGLGMLYVGSKRYMIIQEDLNGRTFGRVPSELSASGNDICEMFLLDMDIENPNVDDLVRLAVTPFGAEITGACVIGEDMILFNSQHAAASNPFPYNHSLTVALTGLSRVNSLNETPTFSGKASLEASPNPVARTLNINKVGDYALYNATGMRVKVVRNTDKIDVSDLTSGTYILLDEKRNALKIVVE